jgi:hypothetical protein
MWLDEDMRRTHGISIAHDIEHSTRLYLDMKI